jgi:hypothetical protein
MAGAFYSCLFVHFPALYLMFFFFYVLHTTTTSLFWAFHSKSMVALEGSVYLTWFFFYHIMHGLIFIYIFCFSCSLKLSFWAFHSKSTVASGGDVYLAYSNLIFAKFLHNVFLAFYMLLMIIYNGNVDNERSTNGILGNVDMVDLWKVII